LTFYKGLYNCLAVFRLFIPFCSYWTQIIKIDNKI